MNSPRAAPRRLAACGMVRHLAGVNAALALLLLLTSLASAEIWKVRHLNAAQPIREGNPISLQLEMVNPTTRPVEGRIESVVKIGSHTLVHHVSPPMVLAPGPQSVDLLLPPSDAVAGTIRTAELEFVNSAGTRVGLGIFPLPLPQEPGLRFIVAHVKSPPIREEDHEIMKRFDLAGEPSNTVETPPPTSSSVRRMRSAVNTFTLRQCWLRPDHVAFQPIGLSAYDCLVLHPDAWEELRAKQLDAIAQWVDAGGRLLLFASRHAATPLPVNMEKLQPFLAKLSRDQPWMKWSATPGGALAEVENSPRLLAPGCGRAVVFSSPTAFASEGRSAVLAYLAGADKGEPQPTEAGTTIALESWRALEAMLPSDVMKSLLPDAPKPISVAVITSWMLGFVALAVLGDYWLLGRLRCRKYTWILFPVLTAGAAVGTLIYAQRHMNALEHRATLRVVDLGLDGRILRENRFVAILPAQTRMSREESQQAVLFDVEARSRHVLAGAYSGRGRISTMETEGSLAGTSILQVQLHQWTPVLLHSSSMHGGVDDSGIAWDQMPAGMERYERNALRAAVRYVRNPGAAGATGDLRDAVGGMSLLPLAPGLNFNAPGSGPFGRVPLLPPSATDLIPHLNLPCHGDRDLCILIAIRRDGPNITCYRKIHRFTASQSTTQ
jgi:hypothetical protein